MHGSKNQLRVIQVGTGGFGRNWYTAYLTMNEDLEIVAWADSSRESLEALRKDSPEVPPSRCFASLEDALQAHEADAVVITASLPAHVPVAKRALNAGLHVLVEKPFAGSVAEAKELVDLAASKGLILMVSQNYRHFPAPRAVREIVQSGEFGSLGAVHIDFRRNHVRYEQRRERHFSLPDPLLVDMSIHHFDLIRMVTGQDARRVRCTTWNPPFSSFVHDPTGEFVVETDSGLMITYRGNWCSTGEETPWAGQWTMEFENAHVIWTSRADDTARADRVTTQPFGSSPGRPRRRKLERLRKTDRAGTLGAFVHSVRTGAEPDTSGRDNLGSLALTYAAVEAAISGAWVEVTP